MRIRVAGLRATLLMRKEWGFQSGSVAIFNSITPFAKSFDSLTRID
jgi:hypothetical protein